MKKHALILCLILILAFSVSCAPAQKESAPVPTSEAKGQPSESGTAAKQQITSEVKELLDKSKTKVKNIFINTGVLKQEAIITSSMSRKAKLSTSHTLR